MAIWTKAQTRVKLVSAPRLIDPKDAIPGYTEADSVIMRAIAQCYQTQPSPKGLAVCRMAKHNSVFEHVQFAYDIFDVSTALLGQLTRHRIGVGFTVESQRHVDYRKKPFRVVIPPSVEKASPEVQARWVESIQRDIDDYCYFADQGIPIEDARYRLGRDAACNLAFSCNLRELMHILDLRLAPEAQWEIRELSRQILEVTLPYAPESLKEYAC